MKFEVRDATVGWAPGQPVQRFVNMQVCSGEVCCVLGPNGCGKTTLFRSMLGLMPLLGGRASVDGTDVRRMPPKRLAATMAYVAQGHTAPFPYTVREVVLMGRVPKVATGAGASVADHAAAERAMREVGVWELRDEDYTDISGGELQLTMIARALAQEPLMLVLDEPTAALDYGNAARVIGKVRELAAAGYAVLMTTHSPNHAFMCRSNVLLLRRDAPPAFGRAVDVITERNMRAAYGVGVRVVEFVDNHGEVMRMCAPTFDGTASGFEPQPAR